MPRKDRFTPRGNDYAARIRAAAAYADLDRKAFGDALGGLSVETISEYFTTNKTPDPVLLDRIAKACPGVPPWFLLYGFDGAANEHELAERVEALGHRLDTFDNITPGGALALLEQALPDLVPALRRALAEEPSTDADPDQKDGASGAGGA